MAKQSVAANLETLRKGRILFSHHSVGANILEGLRRLDSDMPGPSRLNIVGLDEAARIQGPALIEMSGGRNTEPKTKIDAFAATLRDATIPKPDVALMKLCYVDFNPSTNVEDLFAYYRTTIESLKREFPNVKFAHVSAPLMAQPQSWKWSFYRLVGKQVWEDEANVKRAEYNRLLKETFPNDPIFDLAAAEATAPDGNRATFEYGGQTYFALYPGYTEDGGHLNAAGQRAVATAAVDFMAATLQSMPAH